jgi:methionyl-tRNA formyltransferase
MDIRPPAAHAGAANSPPAGDRKERGPSSRAAGASDSERSTRAASPGPAAASSLRAVFMGTPDFAAVILDRLLQADWLDITAVYTQPDRPAGRGRGLRLSPVKILAQERGLAVEQPQDFTRADGADAAVAALAAHAPDVLLVAAYGLILPQRVLDIPRLMPVNVHASLLPKYRGAAPIQRAIMRGENVTGVSIMRMEAGLDSGPILLQRAIGIDINDTAATLHEEMADEGARLLLEALQRLLAGALCEIPQDHARATYAPKLRKEDGLPDLSLPAESLHAHIRGVTPRPGASLILHRDGQPDCSVQIEPGVFPLTDGMRQALAAHGEKSPRENIARVIGLKEGALLLSCGGGYALRFLRPAGRKRMDAAAFYNGYLAGAAGVFFSGR